MAKISFTETDLPPKCQLGGMGDKFLLIPKSSQLKSLWLWNVIPKSVQDKMGIGFSTVASTGWEWHTQVNLTNPLWEGSRYYYFNVSQSLLCQVNNKVFCLDWGCEAPRPGLTPSSTSPLITPMCHHRESERYGNWQKEELLKWGSEGPLTFSMIGKNCGALSLIYFSTHYM